VLTIFSSAFISAQEEKGFWASWKTGEINNDLLKYMLLIIVTLVVFMFLAVMNFPSKGSGVIRLLLSVFVGFLGTWLIKGTELYAVLVSYSGLGFAITVFLPIIILVFITLGMGKKGNMFGIYSSIILWVIYSLYVFFKGAVILMSKATPTFLGDFFGQPFWYETREFFIKAGLSEESFKIVGIENIEPIWGYLLMILGIATFVFGVLLVGKWRKWMMEKLSDSQIDIWADTVKKASANLGAAANLGSDDK